VGAITPSTWLQIGQLNFFEATIGAWLAMLVSHLLRPGGVTSQK
jgi:hypothetical protein